MKRRLTITSEPVHLRAVRKMISEFALKCGFKQKDAELIVLGVDEACSNIIRHAYQGEPGCRIQVLCEKLSGRVRFKLRDFGCGCDSYLLAQYLKARPLDRVRPGGLGLHFMQKAFDEIQFLPQQKGTELVLIKRLCSGGL